MIAVSEDLTIANLNRSAAKMLGIDFEGAVGKPLIRVIRPDEELTRALRNKTLFRNKEITSVDRPG